MSLAIGVDLGGTKIAAGVVNENGQVIDQLVVPTPKDTSAAVVSELAKTIQSLAQKHSVVDVCVAAPGFVDAARTEVLFTANLPMRNVKLKAELEKLTFLNVVIENDANAAAWAEYKFGAAVGSENAVMLTLGTGLGGGLITNGELVRGAFGVAAEVGHMTLIQEGLQCGCGLQGCWEQYASGSALLRIARKLAQKYRDEADILLSLGDRTPEGVEGIHITQAAEKGCPIALRAFNEVAKSLGSGMASLAALLDPQIFVIGGGVSQGSDYFLNAAAESFSKNLTARDYRPIAQIKLAKMGNDAGLIGAADLARRK
ncbi:MAG: ROK family glucokinase [Actinobacteria bacterium]|nr:ROK family glucokinase [Actinomycetota bacterium]